MRKITLFGVLGTLVVGCGGGDETPPAKTPETTAVIAPTTTTTVETKKEEVVTTPKKSFTEQRDLVLKAFGDAVTSKDAKKASAIMTDDVSFTMIGMPEGHGKADADKAHEMWFSSVGDIKAGFAQTFCSEKEATCAIHWAWTSTDSKGLYPGAKPTNKAIGGNILTYVWLNADGLVKKQVNYLNMISPLAQAGLVPPGTPANMAASLKKMSQPVPTLPASVENFVSSGSETETKNIEVVKTRLAAFDNHKTADVLATNTDDLEHWGNDMDKPMKGKAEAKKIVDGLFAAFPDAKEPATTWLAAGDFVVTEEAFTGTQKKAFMGMPATNKSSTMHSAWVYQLKGGKIAKTWAFSNPMEGAPAPAAPVDSKAMTPAAKADTKAPAAKADAKTGPAKK